ncbi:MAG: hypothetical protein AAGD10_08455 [Myxococcota bacterium]
MKHIRWALSPHVFLVLPLALAACGDERASPEDYDDIAVALSALSVDEGGDAESVIDAAEIALGEADLSSEGEGRFDGVRGGIAYAYAVDCFNARDVPLDTCDSRTRRAEIDVAIDGVLSTQRQRGTLDRDGRWTLSVAPDLGSVTLDGEVSSDVASSFEALRRDEERSLNIRVRGIYQSIVFDRTSQEIVGGRIVLTLSAQRMRSSAFVEVEASFDVEATIEFSADALPLLTLDGERRYEIVDQRPVPMPPEAN